MQTKCPHNLFVDTWQDGLVRTLTLHRCPEVSFEGGKGVGFLGYVYLQFIDELRRIGESANPNLEGSNVRYLSLHFPA
jgi:hypothetical protein